MSDNLKDVSLGIERLVGQTNYHQWTRDFRALAQMKGLWKHFTREGAQVLYPTEGTHWKEGHHGEYSACLKCSDEMKAWSDEQLKTQQAIGLLRFCVDPAIRCDISTFIEDPHVAWKLLECDHKPDEKHALNLAKAKMEALRFENFPTVSMYMNQVNQIAHDIRAAGGEYDAADAAWKVREDLPEAFRKVLGPPNPFQELVSQLYPDLKARMSLLLIAEVEIQAQQQAAPHDP
jgi:hypothetical protein